MSSIRIRRTCKLLLLFVLAHAISCSKTPAKGIADARLEAILLGCRGNFADFRSGEGSVEVHRTTSYIKNGSVKVVETSGSYRVAFKDARYRCDGTTTYIRNELHPSSVRPGTTDRFCIANDGVKVTQIVNSVGSTSLVQSKACPEKTCMELAMLLPVNMRTRSGHGIGVIENTDKPKAKAMTGKGIRIAATEEVDGHPCTLVEAVTEIRLPDGRLATNTYKYWVDPKRGFCIPLVQVWSKDDRFKKPVLFAEFRTKLREYAQGFWGPERYTFLQNQYDSKRGVVPFMAFETTYSPDFRFNIPVSSADLRINIPPGVAVKEVGIPSR